MESTVPTVSQVVNDIKNVLEGQFRSLAVVGEISNLSRSGAGHFYFTLSDSQASLNICLFRMDAMRNPLVKDLKDGDKIVAMGSVGVYAKRGSFQLIAKRITPAGQGDLKLQLEKLKKKLASEGLFDLEHKKAIPRYSQKIGLITAEGSAAYHDFINVTKRRSAWMNVLFSPATVQGQAAPESLRKALFNLIAFHQKAPEGEKLDCIVLTRGGGSLEDLWAFNDEALAWDIYNCPIPVISAVGHEVDFSISDFVADMRCETPTAAAEVLSEGQSQLLDKLHSLQRTLGDYGEKILYINKERLGRANPENLLRIIEGRLYKLERRLESCKIEGRLAELTGLHEKTMRLEECLYRLKDFPKNYSQLNERLEHQRGMLRLLNPNNILGRGYTFVKAKDGSLVGNHKKFKNILDNETLEIHFSDGIGVVHKGSEVS